MSVSNLEQPVTASQIGWRGGASPFGIGRRKLGMWLFILSDSMTFGALLAGYVYLRMASEEWPKPFALWPEITLATIMTVCLLASSLTMNKAVSAASSGERKTMRRWMLATVVGGLAFVTLHLFEWHHQLGEGLRIFPKMYFVPDQADIPENMFGPTFFTLTGFHLLHVLSGLIYIGVIALRRKATREDVETCGLYWQFVDAVWLVIFAAVYLFSMK